MGSTVHIVSTTALIFVTLLDFICSVTAEICPSGIECDYNEHCCEDGCCAGENNYGYAYGYGFYNLWYFWFVIIMVMMTCCGACSYVKKRQYYMRQQEGLARSAHLTGTQVHHPPTTYGVHPSNLATPVGAFPGPPAYNEVTGKPDQFPKADYGYPNYGFAAPPYSPHEASMPPQSTAPAPDGTIPVHTTTADGTIPVQYPPSAAMPYPPSAAMAYPPPHAGAPTAATPDSVPTTAPPPYTPSVTSPPVLSTDQSNLVA
ncbi:WW domain binding protein 1-like [Strongylocentrotus purpuratus]|uniref:WW domain binding protein VOPP1 n=1 Tax=Strongylocentrotus purpuratus TaxID=7668 RepID=A0A7M7STM0_STRPU|nr:WW domain binding protein 1-like [Strongylocentrotus purpuratus]|eukprot:XP_782362.1 PREDICTED: YLP motif-containing protein 1 [Strongylocentrotus purpuratus]